MNVIGYRLNPDIWVVTITVYQLTISVIYYMGRPDFRIIVHHNVGAEAPIVVMDYWYQTQIPGENVGK